MSHHPFSCSVGFKAESPPYLFPFKEWCRPFDSPSSPSKTNEHRSFKILHSPTE
jgi:hypothetical protein